MNPDYVLSDKIIRKLNKFINYLNSFVKACADANNLILYQKVPVMLPSDAKFQWQKRDDKVFIFYHFNSSINLMIEVVLFSRDTQLGFLEGKVFKSFQYFIINNFYIVKKYKGEEYFNNLANITRSLKPAKELKKIK